MNPTNQTDKAKAYKDAYNAAQAGGMNETESDELGREAYERVTNKAETARPTSLVCLGSSIGTRGATLYPNNCEHSAYTVLHVQWTSDIRKQSECINFMEQIVRAVNEYDALKSELCKVRTELILLKQENVALCAVAEAAKNVEKIYSEEYEAWDVLREALANLAAVRSGKE